MSDLYWLTDEQMARLRPYFPKEPRQPRVDDKRVLSGIVFVNRNGLRWRDAMPPTYLVRPSFFWIRLRTQHSLKQLMSAPGLSCIPSAKRKESPC